MRRSTMSPFEPLADPPRRGARGHVEALRESLDLVAGRLREGVADDLARSVAGAVRQAVLALLAGAHARPGAPPPSPMWGPVRYPVSAWGREEEEERLD